MSTHRRSRRPAGCRRARAQAEAELALVLARLRAAFGPVTVLEVRPNSPALAAADAQPAQSDAQGEQAVLRLETAGEKVRQA